MSHFIRERLLVGQLAAAFGAGLKVHFDPLAILGRNATVREKRE
jgi:hypothetical protein